MSIEKFFGRSLRRTFGRAAAAVLTAAMIMLPAEAVGIGTVYATGGLKLRAGASSSAEVIAVLPNGSEVTAIDHTDGWYKVVCGGMTGYMAEQYLNVEHTATYSTPLAGKVTGSVVNLRSAPDLSAAVITQLSLGTEIVVTGVNSSWYAVTSGNFSGYLHPDYVELVGEATPTTAPPETPTAMAEPPVAPDPAPSSENPEGGEQTGKSDNGGASGSAQDETKFGVVTGSVVNVRAAANTSAAVVTKLPRGTEVTVTGESDGWYAITYGGVSGYMSAEYLRVGSSSGTGTTNSALRAEIVAFAKQYLGVKYTYGGKSPSSGFDCSGFVYYVFNQFGYTLNPGASNQMLMVDTISRSELQPGDLVFFNDGSASIASHVGIYIGDGQFIHATSPGHPVSINSLSESYYGKCYVGSGRVFD